MIQIAIFDRAFAIIDQYARDAIDPYSRFVLIYANKVHIKFTAGWVWIQKHIMFSYDRSLLIQVGCNHIWCGYVNVHHGHWL